MYKWVPLRAELGNFHNRRTIYIFTLKASFLSVLLSLLVVVIALPILSFMGALTLPLTDCLRLGIVLSWLIGGVVSGILAALTGYSMHEISVSRAEFERLSRTDTLSGLYNRRAFAEALDAVVADASLVIFDVDRFKAINDRYGHASGDAVIVAISRTLSAIFSGADVVARLGGEEFGVIICGGSVAERVARIECAKTLVCGNVIPIAEGDIRVTISAGIADIWMARNKEAIYAAADKALYTAKALGRNRVVHEGEIAFSYSRHRNAGEGEAGGLDILADEAPPQYSVGA